jgi:hypothetical protein
MAGARKEPLPLTIDSAMRAMAAQIKLTMDVTIRGGQAFHREGATWIEFHDVALADTGEIWEERLFGKLWGQELTGGDALITDKALVVSLFSREPQTEKTEFGTMREEPMPSFRFLLVPTTEGPAIFECLVVESWRNW